MLPFSPSWSVENTGVTLCPSIHGEILLVLSLHCILTCVLLSPTSPLAPAAIIFSLDVCNISLGRFPAPGSCTVPLSNFHTAAWVIKGLKILKGIALLSSSKHWLSSPGCGDQVWNPQAWILVTAWDLVPATSTTSPGHVLIESLLHQQPAFLTVPFYPTQVLSSPGTMDMWIISSEILLSHLLPNLISLY